jgi:hypothetical protein
LDVCGTELFPARDTTVNNTGTRSTADQQIIWKVRSLLRSKQLMNHRRTVTKRNLLWRFYMLRQQLGKLVCNRLRLKCDGTRAESRFRLSAKRISPFKSAGASVQSTTGRRAVRISGSNAGYTIFRGSVKSTGYPLHSPVSPSISLLCVTVCHHVSTGL